MAEHGGYRFKRLSLFAKYHGRMGETVLFYYYPRLLVLKFHATFDHTDQHLDRIELYNTVLPKYTAPICLSELAANFLKKANIMVVDIFPFGR